MTAGNILALNQPDLRYILAYSSIAQMGYILLGFGIGMAYKLELGFTAGLDYAIVYGIMKAVSSLQQPYSAGQQGRTNLLGCGALVHDSRFW